MSQRPSLSDLTANLIVPIAPLKIEETPRRVRGLLDKQYVFDTTHARHVWEKPYYPHYYIPIDDIKVELTVYWSDPVAQGVFPAFVECERKDLTRVLVFEEEPLKGLVRFAMDDLGIFFNVFKLFLFFRSTLMFAPAFATKLPTRILIWETLDAWFEEDEPIYGHPKDPYKRIDILPSSRDITVMIDGVTIAKSSNNMFLFETSLKPRYYMPKTSLQWQYVTDSETTTRCPYKGLANYYNITVNDKTYKDVLWWYKYPTAESARIAGLACFYNEKVDLYVDGVQEEKYTSQFV